MEEKDDKKVSIKSSMAQEEAANISAHNSDFFLLLMLDSLHSLG